MVAGEPGSLVGAMASLAWPLMTPGEEALTISVSLVAGRLLTMACLKADGS